MKIANIQEMRRIESETDARGHSYAAMMEMAGRAVAGAAVAALGDPISSILILVGPGNNGGDGLVAARVLRELGHLITLYIWRRDVHNDTMLRQLRRKRRGLTVLFADQDPDGATLRRAVAETDLVIDALLGTGGTRPIEGSLATLLDTLRESLELRREQARLSEGQAPRPSLRYPLLEAFTSPGEPANAPGPGGHPADDRSLARLTGPFDAASPEPEAGQERTEPAATIRGEAPAVLAVDCPTGLNCDTGFVDPHAVCAALTVSFAYAKWGQVQEPGASACGTLAIAEIGVPADLDASLTVELADRQIVRGWLPARPAGAHKGVFGKAMIAGGSRSYTGAMLLSGGAAVLAGAGLVTLAVPEPLHGALSGSLPEATWLLLPAPVGVISDDGAEILAKALKGYDALLVGPGLSTNQGACEFVARLFTSGAMDHDQWQGRVVVDADGLNCLARIPGWATRLPPHSVLTPHPGEMARLTGLPLPTINNQRIACAREWASAWGHIVVLKGPYTAIASPAGATTVLPFALPLLATAGSGDVLAGAITAFLAQGVLPFEAAVSGAYLHAQAALILRRECPLAPIAASDLLARFRQALQELYAG